MILAKFPKIKKQGSIALPFFISIQTNCLKSIKLLASMKKRKIKKSSRKYHNLLGSLELKKSIRNTMIRIV